MRDREQMECRIYETKGASALIYEIPATNRLLK